MKKRKKLTLGLLLVLMICGCGGGGDGSLSLSPGGDSDGAIDVSGTWEGSMIFKKYNDEQISFELTQNNSDIFGAMAFGDHQSDDVTGSVEGSAVTLSAKYPANGGGELEFAYLGKVEGRTISGTFIYYLRGDQADEGTFSMSSDEPVDTTFSISFDWGDIPLCTSGNPNTVGNPRFTLSNVPEGTRTIQFTMTDLDVPTFNHGGGTVQYNGENVIEFGVFEYQSPCPPNGSHRYEWTAVAIDANGTVIGEARAARDYPE